MKIYDISQTIQEGIAVWPGDREFRREWNMRLEEGNSCNLSSVTMSLHTGTHLDAPYHYEKHGQAIADMPLRKFIGPARVVTMKVDQSISARDLAALNWNGVERVLFKTFLDESVKSAFDSHFSFLTEDGARFLGERGLFLAGTDAPSVDAFDSRTLIAHKTLLRYGVAILEGVRLTLVPDGDYELICLPLKLAGADGSPVRAILRR